MNKKQISETEKSFDNENIKNGYDYDSNRTEGRNLYNETGILNDIDSNEDNTKDSKQLKNEDKKVVTKTENYNSRGNMDYSDDWVYNKNYTSETGKYSDKENLNNNFPSTETQKSNSISAHNEIQSDEIELGNKSMKNGLDFINKSSSTKTNITEYKYHHGNSKKSHKDSRKPDQV